MRFDHAAQNPIPSALHMAEPKQHDPLGLLLELAACDDLPAFRRAIDEGGLPINAYSLWYGRWWSGNKGAVMGYERRTPLMVAALYGSTAVVAYILSTGTVDVNDPCGSDHATALHCAAAGGSAASLQVVNLLVGASADIDKVDAGGRKPADVIARQHPSRKVRAALEAVLRGGSVQDLEKDELFASPAKQGVEKKEYPVDTTLPDIKSGIYGTDEFRMYSFKVKPCSRAYTHDWTECPFVHPGENARRRDPRKYQYSCVPCPDFRKGSCCNGDSCEYAHGVFESWLHPAQYRTRLCKDEVGCNRRVCFFAHKREELRPMHTSCESSPGSMASSPRASVSLPPLDLGAAAAMLLNQPMSPSSSSALAAMAWLNQSGGVVTPSSRLKGDLDFELSGFDGFNQLHQQKQQYLDEDYSVLSPLKPPKKSPPTPMQKHQQMLASALMSSRASAFAKRSQSFIDRGTTSRSSISSHTAMSNSSSSSYNVPPISTWGSPDGRLDWAIRGEDLNKLRKSASFGIRSNGMHVGGSIPTSVISEEPDVSWVQSLVSDVKAKTRYPPYGGGNQFSSWGDQLYLEQEQIFA